MVLNWVPCLLHVADQALLLDIPIKLLMQDTKAQKRYHEEAKLNIEKDKQLAEAVNKETRSWAEKMKIKDPTKYINVQSRRFKPEMIIAVKMSKPKDEVEIRLSIFRVVKTMFN